MFETAEVGRSLKKAEYDKLAPELRTSLLEVQRALAEADFPVVILVNGVDGAGKGETVNLLHEWMDARFLQTTSFGPLTDEERQRPEFWRFWMALPPKGRIGIFRGSWYTDPILKRAYGEIKNRGLDAALIRVNTLEKELVDSGALIIKIWLHLSKDVQRKRLKRLEKDKDTRWRVTPLDWKHFKLYDTFRKTCTRALRETSTGEAPWLIVEGACPRYRAVTVGNHIVDRIRARMDRPKPAKRRQKKKGAAKNPITILDQLDLKKKLQKKRYSTLLEQLQGRLNRLSRRLSKKKVGVIMLFEGWDAGGKGGAIRRAIRALDASQYRVIPVAAPTDEEKAHPYLWRFWRHLPRLGRITIYDRSWYGRVLVERVEGFATTPEWMRAYKEINDFEEQLTDHGIVLLKFWLHISNDEQLRRFKEREVTPWKQHKITEEDYRNRKKWNEYEAAANDMIERTSSEYAPWTLVEANDKLFARIRVLETVCDRLERALK